MKKVSNYRDGGAAMQALTTATALLALCNPGHAIPPILLRPTSTGPTTQPATSPASGEDDAEQPYHVYASGSGTPIIYAKYLPKPVIAAVKARLEKGKIGSAERPTVNGRVLYVVRVDVGEDEYHLTVTASGELLEEKLFVSDSTMPSPAAKGIAAKYPFNDIVGVDRFIRFEGGREGPAEYEVTLVLTREKWAAVRVTSDGKIVGVRDVEPPRLVRPE